MANREQLRVIRAARAGNADAQFALGRHYLFGGDGLPQNFATALHWLDRAARQGSEAAWQLIGTHISFEVAHRAPDMPQLVVWYEKAFDAGVMQAGLVFAQLVQAMGSRADASLHGKALQALQAAAHAGIPEAQWLLAQQQEYATRQPGVTTPAKGKGLVAASLEWTSSAADAGIIAARYALAERAWAIADYATFLRWSLPLARDLLRRTAAASG